MGRRRWTPTAGDLANIERMAGQGMSDREIQDFLGISNDTLQRRRKDTAAFAAAFTRGRTRSVEQVTGWLQEIMANPDPKVVGARVNAMKFYLQHVGGWREKTEISGDKDNPLNVNANVKVPGVAQLLKAIGKSRK